MANSNHLSPAPLDPYQWRESVLSTRSLSFMSTYDALGSPGLSHSRNTSYNWTQRPARPGTLPTDGESEADLEMVDTRESRLENIPELPDSVAESALFTLPREIRDRIYTFCLTATTSLATVEWPSASVNYGLQAQLLQTCSIVHDEAAPLLYSLNNLTFHHPSDANMFARALSPSYSRQYMQHVSLHIKAQDTRLWMPYLTSTDGKRSLKADFPNLRLLNVRYRSNKWNHSLAPDQNMKLWCEDNRLDEIVDGLSHVFIPPPAKPSSESKEADEDVQQKPLNEMSEREFMSFVDQRRPGEDMAFKRQLLELHKAHVPAFVAREPPTVKIVCACRVHTAHFNILTGATPDATPAPPPVPIGPIPPPLPAVDTPALAPTPVHEGETFHGFTALDLRSQALQKHLHDPALGSANVARTPYADKQGILLALEVHCLDPKRDERM